VIRIAVAGVGSLGKHHARIASALPGARLSFLIDTRPAVADIARGYGCAFATDLAALPGAVDACVVSLPTPLHYTAAAFLLNNDIHCLVEKPFTTAVSEAEELIARARERNLTLQIGHVERFNPSIIQAQQYINEPIFFEVNRLGPFHDRMSTAGVVLDLMIHDIDIVLYLARSAVQSIEAIGGSLLTPFEDIAKVRLRFASGAVADLSASRVSFKKYRTIRIFQRDSYLSINYAKPSLKIYARRTAEVRSLADVKVLTPRLPRVEPLRMELEDFVQCCATGKRPLVSGEHGRDALELVGEILALLESGARRLIGKGSHLP